MTAVVFPVATATAATTPKPCETCNGGRFGAGGQGPELCPTCHGQTVTFPVSWLVLPADASVQPGDRITIQAKCEYCKGSGWAVANAIAHRKCKGSGVVTYGEATITEVVSVYGPGRAATDLDRPLAYVWAPGGRVSYFGAVDDPRTDISDQFPDGPPQPGDTCVRLADVTVAS